MSYNKTRENLKDFYDPLEMPGGFHFNHVETLKKIDAYYGGKFVSGSKDSAGFSKYFYNIVKPPCDIATKFIDLDTKDIMLVSDRPDDEKRVWFMQRDLKQWMKENGIGKLLNEIGFDYPKYGTVVVKRNKNEWKKVNIQNLRMDPAATALEDDSAFVYEVLRMTARDIKKMPWNPDEVKRLLESKESFYTVYECYDVQDDGKKWKRSFKADFLNARSGNAYQRTPESQINLQADYTTGVTLFEDEKDDIPYRELHWERIPGRWLGVGYVEYLFDNQVRMNEMVNVKAKGLFFTSLKVFQTRDDTVARNILTGVENGDILKVQSEVTPVSMEERNLGAFTQEEGRWDKNTEQKTFSFDIARGDDLPSNTPLGVARLSAGMVASYFELKRENFGLFVKDVILQDVIPTFVNDTSEAHLLKFLGSDGEIEKLYEAITDAQVRNAVVDHVLKNATVPTPEDVAMEKEKFAAQLKKKKDLFIEIPKAFYKNAEYHIDIIVTGEQVDVGARMQTLQTLMTILASNPMILQDPAAKSVLFKLMEFAGVSPVDLNLLGDKVSQIPQLPQGQQQQMPQMPQQPIMAQGAKAM